MLLLYFKCIIPGGDHMSSFPSAFYRWRPHPWHGLEVGPKPPNIVNAYIEITPFDLVKYEIDKITGYIRVDRPQRTSSQPPTLYGFIPRTYCGQRVNDLSPKADKGDGDPLDICVLSERPVNRSEVILQARVVGGMQAIDNGEADDKIIAVLNNDEFWREIEDISQVPDILVGRLQHYFSTYKMMHGKDSQMHIECVYDCDYALKVVQASIQDYDEAYGA
jgi:inorganic pyrophosphatase